MIGMDAACGAGDADLSGALDLIPTVVEECVIPSICSCLVRILIFVKSFGISFTLLIINLIQDCDVWNLYVSQYISC